MLEARSEEIGGGWREGFLSFIILILVHARARNQNDLASAGHSF
jgi:hypothetical protein